MIEKLQGNSYVVTVLIYLQNYFEAFKCEPLKKSKTEVKAHRPLAVWAALLIYNGSDLVLRGLSVRVKRARSAL